MIEMPCAPIEEVVERRSDLLVNAFKLYLLGPDDEKCKISAQMVMNVIHYNFDSKKDIVKVLNAFVSKNFKISLDSKGELQTEYKDIDDPETIYYCPIIRPAGNCTNFTFGIELPSKYDVREVLYKMC